MVAKLTGQRVFTLPFSQGGHTPKEARSRPDFMDYFNMLWRELEADVKI